MKCMRCRKEKGELQEFPTRSRHPYMLCADCYAERALNEFEYSRDLQISIRSWYVKHRGLPVFEESCHA